MGEIDRVYLSSKIPLSPSQKAECLEDIRTKAKGGFMIEIQKEVMAHTSEETFMFIVRKIEPQNRFYGMVDEGTGFEIMHEDSVPSITATRDTAPIQLELADEPFSDLTEVEKLKLFIDELEALRIKHNISWRCLLKIVSSIEWFGD